MSQVIAEIMTQSIEQGCSYMSRDNRRSLHPCMIGLLCISLFLLFGCAPKEKTVEIPFDSSPLWLTSDPQWIDPPAGVDAAPVTADACVLYFGADGRFRCVTAEMTKSAGDSIAISASGRLYWEGAWRESEGRVVVYYRDTYRTFPIVGENIPGELRVDTLSFTTDTSNGTSLTFDNRNYIVFDKFDSRSMMIARDCWDSITVNELLDSLHR